MHRFRHGPGRNDDGQRPDENRHVLGEPLPLALPAVARVLQPGQHMMALAVKTTAPARLSVASVQVCWKVQ
jgi:hypothetical protein